MASLIEARSTRTGTPVASLSKQSNHLVIIFFKDFSFQIKKDQLLMKMDKTCSRTRAGMKGISVWF
jgi:hypothetical protein